MFMFTLNRCILCFSVVLFTWGLFGFNDSSIASAACFPQPDVDDEWGPDLPKRDKKSTPNRESNPPPRNANAGPEVPPSLALQMQDAMVLVLVVWEDGKDFQTVGWIVDKERRIVMTNRHLVANAVKIIVGFPQLGSENNTVTGSPAVWMKLKTDRDIAYLQVESPIPESLSMLVKSPDDNNRSKNPSSLQSPDGLSRKSEKRSPLGPLGGPKPPQPPTNGFGNNGNESLPGWNDGDEGQSPTPQKNPLIGRWSLQHTGNGIRLKMKAVFTDDNQFQVDMLSVDAEGNQQNESLFGTYTVQGNTIYMQSNEGPQQATFEFKDGYLCIKLPGSEVTFLFQR